MSVTERFYELQITTENFFHAACMKKTTPHRQRLAEGTALLRRRIPSFRHRSSYLYGVFADKELIELNADDNKK